MKLLSLILIFQLLIPLNLFAAGKLQDADFKTEAELISAGATKAQLLNDSKIYVTANGINDKLSTAIANGQLGGGSAVGGVNILANDSFEFGSITSWTNSGGTLTNPSYTNSKAGDTKYANFVATTSGQYFESSLSVVPDSIGAGCMADIDYNGGSGNFTFKILDSSANLLASGTLVDRSTWGKFPTVSFACPAGGAQIKLRIEATGAGTIQADHAYAGGNKNVNLITQFRYLGEINYATSTNCRWSKSSSFGTPFAADTDCATPTVTGEIVAPSTKIPAAKLALARKGTYKITAMGMFGAATGETAWRFTDGTNISQTMSTYVAAVGNTSPVLVGYITLASDVPNWEVALDAGFGGTSNIFAEQNGEEFTLSIEYLPSSSDTAYSPDQSGWFIDANIGGAVISSSGTISSYTELTNAGLDMILRTGSASAKIPCSSTNSPTGLTCSVGNESLGIVFTPPFTGYFDVCASIPAEMTATSGASYNLTAFQLVETPTNSQSISQEGGQRTTFGAYGASSSIVTSSGQDICGTFYFSSISEKAIRLMHEKSGSGAIEIPIDRSSSVGQRDARFTVKPSVMNVARPVLIGNQVITKGRSTGANIVKAKIAGNGTVSAESADFINGNCTNAHPSVCTWNAGYFTSTPSCWLEIDQDGERETAVYSESTTDATMKIWDSTGAAATTSTARKIFCMEDL